MNMSTVKETRYYFPDDLQTVVLYQYVGQTQRNDELFRRAFRGNSQKSRHNKVARHHNESFRQPFQS